MVCNHYKIGVIYHAAHDVFFIRYNLNLKVKSEKCRIIYYKVIFNFGGKAAMLFENMTLNNVVLSDIMDKKFLKISWDMDITTLAKAVTDSQIDVIVVMERNEGKDVPLSIINPMEILKMITEKISLKNYVNKNSNVLKAVLNSNERVDKAIELIINQHVDFILVEEENRLIGVILSKNLLAQYNDMYCKNCNLIEMILDNINDGITVVDKNGIAQFWNRGAEELYNISREMVVGKPITEHFPNAMLPKVLRERKPYENVYNSPRENSHNIISARPLYSGNELIGGVSCDRDISELIKLSKQLNKTQLNLQILEQEVSTLNENRFTFDQIVGENVEFKETVKLCQNVSRSNINILIMGESGTGKEVFSRAIHIESGKKGHFIPINCSAIPRDLMESELFGYEGGAFTGALKKGKIGKFELAHEGTLFLDEIGDMPSHMQPKILRVLEDGFINRVGSENAIKVDVRIIAATNKDLKRMVDEGKFRKDLYYRLNSILITLPPLRERKDDIPLLVKKYFEHYCITYRTNIPRIPDKIVNILMNYDWEGNVRELKNIIERIVILVKNNHAKIVDVNYLPLSIIEKSKETSSLHTVVDLHVISEKAEREAIEKAMKASGGNKAKAAKLLNIPRSTLYFKLEKYNLVYNQSKEV